MPNAMPNDAPDWSTVGSSPAIDLGSFTVPANTIVTVYNGPTPPGCHAVKVYIQSTDPSANAQQVTVIDGTTIHTIQQFLLPRSTSCVCAVDDVSVPNLRVDVQAAFAQQTTGRVVAFLSDQAVAVDNDNSNPIPVNLVAPPGGVGAGPAAAIPTKRPIYPVINTMVVAAAGVIAGGAVVVIPTLDTVNDRYLMDLLYSVLSTAAGAGAGFLSIKGHTTATLRNVLALKVGGANAGPIAARLAAVLDVQQFLSPGSDAKYDLVHNANSVAVDATVAVITAPAY
ncbi:MAG TPA: hypothetical protein VHQ90_00090 [Thermoanaerobaculia bacterium]|nr:hypothetical protein [Thermoanaerobaculia bacterium]